MTLYDIDRPLGHSNAALVPYSPARHDVHLSAIVRTIERVNPQVVGTDGDVVSWENWNKEREGTQLVAIAGGTVIGHVGLEEPGEVLAETLDSLDHPSPEGWGYIEVVKLFTDPQSRGLGFGSYLLGTALRTAREQQLVSVIAVPEWNRGVISFVENFGLVYWGSYEVGDTLSYLYVATTGTINTIKEA